VHLIHRRLRDICGLDVAFSDDCPERFMAVKRFFKAFKVHFLQQRKLHNIHGY
jgi:hypothetical protein